MPESPSSPSFYALLIGIDHYQSNDCYSNLQGCVRDICLVNDFLNQTLHPKQIYKLLAPNPDNPLLLNFRSAQDLPTYANIITAFKQITDQAQANDLVYIHYAGHGGRAITVFEELKGLGQSDESIVPMDIGEQGQYLRDVELATLLKRMTDKGLIVTIVLDSCHSGGATRGDCDIRGSQEIDTIHRTFSSLVASREELVRNWRTLTDNRQSSSWLPASKDYVLLAACRPTEFAYEYAVNGTDRYGALTYWMIDTLKSGIPRLTYTALHDRIRAKIQSRFSNQLPMLLGEGDRIVFGRDRSSLQSVVTVIDVNEAQIILSAGLAQGLSRGTRFAIYPFGTMDYRQGKIAIVELTEVEASSACARILDPVEGGIEIRGQIEQGAPAIVLSAPVDLMRRVRLFDQKQLGNAEHELPTQELVDQQKTVLEDVRQALAGNGWMTEAQTGEGHYQVAIGRQGEFEICMGLPIDNLNPPLIATDAEAPRQVVQRLIHLAKYQAVQELDNPASELTDYLEFLLLDQRQIPFTDQSRITLQEDELIYLRIKNLSTEALNIAVLDLEPTWEISQLPLRGIDAPFYQIAPQEIVDTRLRFRVPEHKNYDQAQEILKLFATRGAADFRWLKLPSLDQVIRKHDRTTRGSHNAFNQLLEAIGEDVDRVPQLVRAAIYEPDPNAEWVTKQIQIQIKRRSNRTMLE